MTDDEFQRFGKIPESAKDRAIADLEDQLSKLNDNILEERFFWLLGVIIFFDAVIFFHLQSNAAIIVLFIFEAAFLFALGRKWGIESFIAFSYQVFDCIKSIGSKN